MDAFLSDLKKALPQDNAKATANARTLTMVDRPVIQTSAASTTAGVNFSGQYTSTPVAVKQAEPAAPQALGYPVAAPLKQPKHLFHFIIRYEGEGLIDANVVKFAKAMNSDNATRNAQAPYAMPLTVVGDAPSAQAIGGTARWTAGPIAKPKVESQSSAPPRPQPAPTQPPPASPPQSESPVSPQ